MSAKRERATPLNLVGAEVTAPVSLLLAEPSRARGEAAARGKPSAGATEREAREKRKRGERRADARVDVRYLVSHLLAEADGETQDALIRVCAAVQDAMGWEEVTFWPADGRAGMLRSGRGIGASAQAVAISTAHSRHAPASIASRIAVVGHVFATGKPAYLTDMVATSTLSTLPAAAAAAATGDRRGTFAFPVWGTTDLLGVVECLSATSAAPDAALLRKAASLGATIGRFIERQRALDEPQLQPPHAAPATEQATPAEAGSSMRQLEAAFDALADSVLIFDREGHILRANAVDRAMLGYDSRSASFATSLHARRQLLMPRDEQGQPVAEDRSPFARILRGETLSEQQAIDATLHTPDGREIEVSTSGAPLVDVTGKLIGGVAVTRDVTEQRRREGRLRDASRRMQEFLAVAAHELKTPITAGKGYVQIALKRLNKVHDAVTEQAPTLAGSIEQLRKNLEDAEHSTQRLTRLVDRLLDVAHIQANKLELRPESVDLAAIIHTRVREQRLATPSRAIRYKVRPIRPVPTVADPDRIGQVLLNYLANALKYSPEESVVEVTLDVRGSAARVSVRDRGQGIPLAEQERIWSRFEQLGDTQQRGFTAGLGLGLYISRAIVEAHGGHVGVQSAVGQGSTFWFDLPLARPAE